MFRQPLLSAWHANWGAVYQTQAELSPDLTDEERKAINNRAITHFEQAITLNPAQPVANRRFGMMALNREVFEVAVVYLSQAYEQEPHNQATLKALGLAYLWTGRLGPAQEIFQHLDAQHEVIEELGVWSWYWGEQGREDLSAYAAEMKDRLSAAP
jgi:tetratricopeptide (TPR) repeat protein